MNYDKVNIFYPAIDPLSVKNKKLRKSVAKRILKNYDVDLTSPIVSQISRFDPWKDPVGVIEVFKKVNKYKKCKLIMCGNMASDDPEGVKVFNQIQKRFKKLIDKGDLILLTANDNFLVNALQTASEVVMQKSIKEGFGLTVTEAMWKKNAVVAGNVGGIKMQIANGENGFLINDQQQASQKILDLLKSKKLRNKIGEQAHISVKNKFLITRLIHDYLKLFKELMD